MGVSTFVCSISLYFLVTKMMSLGLPHLNIISSVKHFRIEIANIIRGNFLNYLLSYYVFDYFFVL